MINEKLIKVCGMRHAQNIRDVEALPMVDMLGLIFYPRSPRYVYELPEYLPQYTHLVGVFVDEDRRVVEMYADRFGLDYVQLHGNESPSYCRLLRDTGLKVIKAFSVEHLSDLRRTADYESVCDLFLFDTKSELHGGSGTAFDWDILHHYHGKRPFLLSGGISPHSVQALKDFTHPLLAGYDLNSRFERQPGEKDTELLRYFFQELK